MKTLSQSKRAPPETFAEKIKARAIEKKKEMAEEAQAQAARVLSILRLGVTTGLPAGVIGGFQEVVRARPPPLGVAPSPFDPEPK